MYAVARINTVDPADPDAARDQLADLAAGHADQPGYLGNLIVDIGANRQLIVNLWQDEDRSNAGRIALGPLAAKHFGSPTRSSEFLGAGPVRADLGRILNA